MTAFLDMDEVSPDEADVHVHRVPYEGTVSYGTGTAAGPDAVMIAGPHLETFDEELEWEADGALRLATLPAVRIDPEASPDAAMDSITEQMRAARRDGAFPLSFGGEHSVTPPIVRGLFDDPSQLTVVQIDAHADLRPEYNGEKNNHACSMRRLLDDLDVRRLVAIGIRSCTAEEFALSRDDARIETFYAHSMRARWSELVETLHGLRGPVYLTVDIDGLDCTLCPGTGTPQPGGLSWDEALDVVRAVTRAPQAQLVGADIVEVATMPSTQINEMVAAKLGFKILGHHLIRRIQAQ